MASYESKAGKESKAAGGGGSGASSPLERSLQAALSSIDESKTGASFRKLPASFKRNIERNLVPSSPFLESARDGSSRLSDEWSTKIGKRTQRVITEMKDGKVHYTVKERNKVLLRTNDKNRVANKIAEFYLSEMK